MIRTCNIGSKALELLHHQFYKIYKTKFNKIKSIQSLEGWQGCPQSQASWSPIQVLIVIQLLKCVSKASFLVDLYFTGIDNFLYDISINKILAEMSSAKYNSKAMG